MDSDESSDESTDGTEALSRIGMRELRGSLASSLRRAGSGERMVITVDGRPTAILGPLEPGGQATLDDLYVAGLALPPRSARSRSVDKNAPSPSPLPVDIRLDDIVADIRGR